MKRFIGLLSGLLLTLTTFAQQFSVVSGRVTDNNNSPVEAVTISLFKAADSSLAKAAISDKNGEYAFENIKNGSYFIRFSSVAHAMLQTATFNVAANKNLEIPLTKLAPAEKKLKDVVVTSQKPMIEVKADRTVFNVENSINATGSNAMELLQKSPGVLVDKDDNISMKGKNGVRIYIDGKPSPMAAADLAAYLRSIQSSDIEAIEMIENPSAKYDASGNAGIINIRLKKNKKYGSNGNVAVGYSQGFYPKENGSLGLNYRNQKVNLFSNFSVFEGRNRSFQNFDRTQNDSVYNSKNISVSTNTGTNVKLGGDYFINSRSTLGFMYNGNYSSGQWVSNGNTLISAQDTKVATQRLIASNQIKNSRNNTTFNLNYRYVDTTGRELNIDADRGIYHGRGNR